MPVARAGITEIPRIYEEFILVLSTANFSLGDRRRSEAAETALST
jgi:hypothetical protein